jgi:hypothetical protein
MFSLSVLSVCSYVRQMAFGAPSNRVVTVAADHKLYSTNETVDRLMTLEL